MSTQHAIIIDIKRVNPDFAGEPDIEYETEESFIAKLDAPPVAKDWADVTEWVGELFDLLDGSDYETCEYDEPSDGVNWHHPMYEVTARKATLYDVPVMDAPGS